MVLVYKKDFVLMMEIAITNHIRNTCNITSFTYLRSCLFFKPSLCASSSEYPEGGAIMFATLRPVLPDGLKYKTK